MGLNIDLSKLTEWLKLSPKYLFPISLVTGFALFASTDVLEIFGISPLVTKIRPYLGITFLLATVLLITNLLISFYSFAQKKYKVRQNLRALQKRLHSLTNDEKRILAFFISNQTRSQYVPINGVVNGLEIEKIIFKASNMGNLDKWAYNIQPWAWDYLNNHHELLVLTQEIDEENTHQNSRR